MLEKLDRLQDRHVEVGALLSDPEVIGDQNRFVELSREYAELEPVITCYTQYRQVTDDHDEAKHLLKDADTEIREMAQEELKNTEVQLQQLSVELQTLLLPKDPNDQKNVFLEIRAGTGGDEAAIFAGDLFRMYSRYAELRGWQVEIMSESASEQGGYKEIITRITGGGVTAGVQPVHGPDALGIDPCGDDLSRSPEPRRENGRQAGQGGNLHRVARDHAYRCAGRLTGRLPGGTTVDRL